jgi:hypothetical protein
MYCFRHFNFRMSKKVYFPGVQSHFLIFGVHTPQLVCGEGSGDS